MISMHPPSSISDRFESGRPRGNRQYGSATSGTVFGQVPEEMFLCKTGIISLVNYSCSVQTTFLQVLVLAPTAPARPSVSAQPAIPLSIAQAIFLRPSICYHTVRVLW